MPIMEVGTMPDICPAHLCVCVFVLGSRCIMIVSGDCI